MNVEVEVKALLGKTNRLLHPLLKHPEALLQHCSTLLAACTTRRCTTRLLAKSVMFEYIDMVEQTVDQQRPALLFFSWVMT